MTYPAAILTTAAEAIQQSSGFERTMLSEDKLYVVLAVVLVIWFGILLILIRNDRKISALERRMGKDSKDE